MAVSEKIDTLIVGGLATDYCVEQTVLQLRKAGFRVIVNLSAVHGVGEDSTLEAIQAMGDAGAEFIADASDIAFRKNGGP